VSYTSIDRYSQLFFSEKLEKLSFKKSKIVPQFFDGIIWKVMIEIGPILFLHADIFEILFA